MILLALAYLGRGQQELRSAGFKETFYQLEGYSGSRVLDTNHSSFTHAAVNWTNQGTFDSAGNRWIVDKAQNTLVLVNASDTSLPFIAYGEVVAGIPGTAGFLDGGNAVALFNAPTGVAVWNQFVFIADTMNHCIRKVDTSLQMTITIAGVPGQAGNLDGDGTVALFNEPSALGIDSATGTLYVLDNGTRIRKLTLTTNGLRTFVNVITLVQGACRAQRAFSIDGLIIREVWCQSGWEAAAIPAEKITTWQWSSFCAGNTLTCIAT